MLKARVTLKNLESLTYNFLGSDSTLAMEFNVILMNFTQRCLKETC